MKDFRTLKVWGKAHGLTLFVYKYTQLFPKQELYGLTSQMRRAAASVPANIAEGCGRSGSGEFHRFLSVAMGSAVELEYFLLLARDLTLLSCEVYESVNDQVLEVQRMLGSLIRKVEAGRAATGSESASLAARSHCKTSC
jgi:four helix bundle protein